jgi:hypothetical protein
MADLIALKLSVPRAGAGSRVGLNRAFEKHRVVEPIERDGSNSGEKVFLAGHLLSCVVCAGQHSLDLFFAKAFLSRPYLPSRLQILTCCW